MKLLQYFVAFLVFFAGFAIIELFTECSNFILDADAFKIPGEINVLD